MDLLLQSVMRRARGAGRRGRGEKIGMRGRVGCSWHEGLKKIRVLILLGRDEEEDPIRMRGRGAMKSVRRNDLREKDGKQSFSQCEVHLRRRLRVLMS